MRVIIKGNIFKVAFILMPKLRLKIKQIDIAPHLESSSTIVIARLKTFGEPQNNY